MNIFRVLQTFFPDPSNASRYLCVPEGKYRKWLLQEQPDAPLSIQYGCRVLIEQRMDSIEAETHGRFRGRFADHSRVLNEFNKLVESLPRNKKEKMLKSAQKFIQRLIADRFRS